MELAAHLSQHLDEFLMLSGREILYFVGIGLEVEEFVTLPLSVLGQVVVDELPVALAEGGEVGAAMLVRVVHQEVFGLRLVRISAEQDAEVRSVDGMGGWALGGGEFENGGIEVHDSSELGLRLSAAMGSCF